MFIEMVKLVIYFIGKLCMDMHVHCMKTFGKYYVMCVMANNMVHTILCMLCCVCWITNYFFFLAYLTKKHCWIESTDYLVFCLTLTSLIALLLNICNVGNGQKCIVKHLFSLERKQRKRVRERRKERKKEWGRARDQ